MTAIPSDRLIRFVLSFEVATGPTGETGTVGSNGSFSPYYAHIFSTSAQVVNSGADVTLDSNGALSGITYTPGGTQITVTVGSEGVYLITYTVDITAPGTAEYAVTINGVPQQDLAYRTSTNTIDTLQLTGSGVVRLIAGAIVTLRNIGTAANTLALAPNAAVGLILNASI